MAEVGETNKAENDDDHKTDNSTCATASQAHPWPYLQTMFRFKSVESKTVRFVCLLCTPKVTECSAYTNSPSNLKKHVDFMSDRRNRLSDKHFENLVFLKVNCWMETK